MEFVALKKSALSMAAYMLPKKKILVLRKKVQKEHIQMVTHVLSLTIAVGILRMMRNLRYAFTCTSYIQEQAFSDHFIIISVQKANQSSRESYEMISYSLFYYYLKIFYLWLDDSYQIITLKYFCDQMIHKTTMTSCLKIYSKILSSIRDRE